MEKRCHSCMMPIGDAKVCDHCGYEQDIPNGEGRLEAGTMLKERYYIGKVIKSDSISSVYSAYDTALDSHVIIRECDGIFAEGIIESDQLPLIAENEVQRFLKFGRSIAEVNLCDVLPRTVDVFENDKKGYIVNEFFDGKSVRELLKEGINISGGSVYHIAQRLCTAVKALHAIGTIYGTVSPENVYILRDGDVRLYGIGSPFFDNITNFDARVEYINPSYAAPELFQTEATLGTYTDVYSVAAVMYRLLTHTIPPVSFLRSRNETVRSIRMVNKNVSSSVDAAIINALLWQSTARTQSITGFMRDLVKKGVKRKFTFQIVLSYILCFFKNVSSSVTNFFSSVKKKKKDASNKKTVSKKTVAIISSICAGIVILSAGAVIVFKLIGKDTSTKTDKNGSIISGNADNDVVSGFGYHDTSSKKTVDNSSKNNVETSSVDPNLLTVCPSVEGLTQSDAESKLLFSDLAVGNITEEYSSSVEAGYVISQSVSSGIKCEKGKKVSLVISKGSKDNLLIMPDIVGMNVDKAIKKLENLGIGYNVEYVTDSSEAGTVIAQSPERETEVMFSVTITVSGEMVFAPNYIGMTLAEATREGTLTVVKVYDENGKEINVTEDGYTVTEQNVASGSETYKGREVILNAKKK